MHTYFFSCSTNFNIYTGWKDCIYVFWLKQYFQYFSFALLSISISCTSERAGSVCQFCQNSWDFSHLKKHVDTTGIDQQCRVNINSSRLSLKMSKPIWYIIDLVLLLTPRFESNLILEIQKPRIITLLELSVTAS